MPLLLFSELGEFTAAIRAIRKTFVQALPEDIKFAAGYDTIVKYAIRQIDIGLAIDLTDPTALNECCARILEKLGYYSDGKILDPLWDGHTAWSAPVFHYFRHVLGFNDLPRNILGNIDRLVREDLRQLMTLIQFYESSEKAVKTYLAEGTVRGEHEDKIRLDFYFRCLNERNIIVEYLTFGIEKRAFERSMNDDLLGGQPGGWIAEYQDRPYRWWMFNPKRYFDYRLIDSSRHRLHGVNAAQFYQLEALRETGDRAAFYAQLSTIKPPAAIFHRIRQNLEPLNHLLSDRKPIFEELQQLFEHSFWYGFTALALPQVEGIFSDMTRLLSPDKKFSSLPHKVSAVRPFYDYHENTFDHFEYILPRLRNRFLHLGNVEGDDFGLRALELLYDLDYILDVFNSLKDDQITLINLLNNHPELHLIAINNYNKLFQILKSLRQRQKKYPTNKKLSEVLARWDQYEKEVLSQSGIYLLRWSLLKFGLKDKTVELFNALSVLTKDLAQPIDLYRIKLSELRPKVDTLKAALGDQLHAYREQYNDIMDMYAFLEQFREHLPTFDPDHAEELVSLYKEEKRHDRMGKMHLLKPLFTDTTAS
ncbi:hypothetical protein [Mucilaginibacter lacusdianchii]|uniref:hypothetical protein n=1 Tax=Mucilaginibacter lacusdianchii TaxID=2684211 RepID=UPI00131CB98B|nr:hypothetical protein [Mucilaginibacter sp. JXJ CY 39]